eukprot:IDg5502t1
MMHPTVFDWQVQLSEYCIQVAAAWLYALCNEFRMYCLSPHVGRRLRRSPTKQRWRSAACVTWRIFEVSPAPIGAGPGARLLGAGVLSLRAPREAASEGIRSLHARWLSDGVGCGRRVDQPVGLHDWVPSR